MKSHSPVNHAFALWSPGWIGTCLNLLWLSFTLASLPVSASDLQHVKPTLVPVILDTDIGDDIDDTWALALLLKSPELDLKLVVGDYGEAQYRARLLAKFLDRARRTDVPVGVGLDVAPQGDGRQTAWVKDYELKSYPGKILTNGVQAIIDTVMNSPQPVTLICIGPAPNIAEALKREPRIALHARFVGMDGSVSVGYGSAKQPCAEWNVKADPKAMQAVFAAPWDITITPLDTCGLVTLKGEKYRRILDSTNRIASDIITNYRLWLVNQPALAPDMADQHSSTLFDPVAVYLAMDQDFCVMEKLNLRVTDDGFTVIDPQARPVNVAKQWKDLGSFEDFLVERLSGTRADLPVISPPVHSLTSASAQYSSTNQKYWVVEDANAREKLPLYLTIPAAKADELTPANGYPKRKTFLTWNRSHGDNGGMRYSALNQINRQNVTNLQVAWIYHSKDGSNAIQCNPIIVRKVMIVPTPGKCIVGVNAENGQELWRFKPEGGRPAFRGLIYWPGNIFSSERVLFCSGQYLYALDPKNGRLITQFGENGRVLLPESIQDKYYIKEGYGAATAGPAIFKHVIVVPGFEKDVWGFDVVSGKQLWTFHTVPHPGEFGYDTWDRTENYAANDWTGMAMDEVRGIVYISTAGAKPNFIGVWHRGDNLFCNCLIALDARTGKRLWHFQEIPHDIWDRDVTAPPNLATITHEGKRVDAVAVTTKSGNTLLLDRVTGKLIFPFRMRRAPASDLPGEVTAPYQPDPELPEPFEKMEFTAADLTDRTPEAAEFAATRFKSVTTGFFRPASLGHPNLYFGMDGGAEWSGACVDAETGRLYVTANHVGWLISIFRDDDPPDDQSAPKTHGRSVFETACMQCHGSDRLGIGVAPPLRGLRRRLSDNDVINQVRMGKNGMPAFSTVSLSESNLMALLDYLMIRDRPSSLSSTNSERPQYGFTGYPKFLDNEGYPANKPPWGTLNCIDLNTGKLVWKVPLGEYPELTAQGVPKTGTENYGGAIVTAGGLVFCSGTRDYKIRAFDKDTGAELWSGKLPWAGIAPPATYEVNGRQFVVITSTGNKLGKQSEYGDAYVAFALPKLPGK
jgi:quinoprotein glucose dehydrogenase